MFPVGLNPPPPPFLTMVHYAGFSNPNRTRLIAQLWDFIETSSFREDIKGIKDIKYNDNDYKDIAV